MDSMSFENTGPDMQCDHRVSELDAPVTVSVTR